MFKPIKTTIGIDTSSLGLAAKGMTSSNFTVTFSPPISIGHVNADIELRRLQTWNSFFNFSAEYSNLTYEINPGAGPVAVTLDPGKYSFEDWVDTVTDLFTASALGSLPVTFTVNNNTGKFKMVVPVGYVITLTKHMVYMLGFTGGVRLSAVTQNFTAGTYVSSVTPQWNNSITALNFQCDAVSQSSLNGQSGQIIASFSPRVAAFSSIDYEPINPLAMQINKPIFNTIAFRITDQSGNLVDLNGEDVTFQMVITDYGGN